MNFNLHLDIRKRMTPEARERALKRIIGPSRPSASYYLLVCLSAVIATFGLLANSTAVVIGAMLVAPLMGPIFGIALSLSTGDRKLLKTAIFAELVGIILAVGLPAVIGLIPLRPDFGTEIIARTQPTIYDVLIALASGLAGAYALVDEKISPALPGVAIATALVPPLAACGLNIAAGNWILAWGAFLLFLVNFIAIEFAAASIFMLLGLVDYTGLGNGAPVKAAMKRLGVSFLILLLATTFMTRTLIHIVQDKKLDSNIRSVMAEQLTAYAGARLSDIKFAQTANSLQIIATVITPQEFDPLRVARMEKSLQANINPNTQLIVRSVISKDADRNGPVFISAEEIKQRDQTNQETDFMNRVSQVLSDEVNIINGAQVTEVSKDVKNGVPTITASVRTPQAITPAEVQNIEQRLNREVDENIKLVVRSILTKDADSTHYMTASSDPGEVLQGQELDLYKSLLNEVTWYLSQDNQGIVIAELQFEQNENTISVYMAINTPITISPAKVAELQEHLHATIDPRIKLTVKSIVGGTANADAYTTLPGQGTI
ncbi:MAG: TIGR00341 family protein [Syntrophomonas sp.]